MSETVQNKSFSVFNKAAFQDSMKQKSYRKRSIQAFPVTWRGRRDLNPRAGFIQPTPLAGEPLRPLGYFCKSNMKLKGGGESGIRTHGRLHVAGFQDRFLQPLGHLSIMKAVRRLNTFDMIPYGEQFCQQVFAESFLQKILEK